MPHATRRAVVLSSLPFSLSLVGCASPYPKNGLSGLPVKAIAVQEPRFEPQLKVKISAWARMASSAGVREEEHAINNALGPWSDIVVGRFTETLAAGLRGAAFEVDRMPPDGPPMQERHAARVRSHLTAGFVNKTFTSATYAPFVMVVLEANLRGGGTPYHQLYVACDRSINPFMTHFPPATPYVFADVGPLRQERDQALEALATLAAQLGQQFAKELSS